MRELSVRSLLLVVLSFVVMYFLLLQFHQFKVDRQALIYNELHFGDKYYLSDTENPANLIAELEEWALDEAISLDGYWVNPHLFRSLLVRPFTLLSGVSQLSLDLIFSIAAVCYLIISSLVTFYTLPSAKRNITSAFAIFSLFFVVSFFMNGRLIHAFVASSLLLFMMTYFNKLPLIYILGIVVCSLFFATVSSGIFFFLVSYIGFCLCMQLFQRIDLMKSITLLMVVVALSSSYLFSILHKLVKYYNGNFVEGVFFHGAGRLMNSISSSVCILLGGCIVPLVLFSWKKREFLRRWLVENYSCFFMLIIGFGGCVVGFSAVTVTIPAFCILCFPLILPNTKF